MWLHLGLQRDNNQSHLSISKSAATHLLNLPHTCNGCRASQSSVRTHVKWLKLLASNGMSLRPYPREGENSLLALLRSRFTGHAKEGQFTNLLFFLFWGVCVCFVVVFWGWPQIPDILPVTAFQVRGLSMCATITGGILMCPPRPSSC